MPPSHEQDRAEFQRALDGVPANGTMTLMPREYPGPVNLSGSMTLDGQGSTVWSQKGPVIFCQVPGITLRNLRIEVTGDADASSGDDDCALKVQPGCTPTLENVEVRGSVSGIPEEEGDWRCPRAVAIGAIPFGSEHDLIIRIWVPVPCEISSRISGLEVQPHKLEPGTNEVTLHLERLAKDTLLSGYLFVSTPHLKRSISVSGSVSGAKPKKSKKKTATEPWIVYQPSDWEALLAMPRPQPTPQIPATLPPPPPPPDDPSSLVVPVSDRPVVQSSSTPESTPELTKPSGPSIQWPPPPPVLPPQPPPTPITSPQISPPTVPGPSIQWPPPVLPPEPPVVSVPPEVTGAPGSLETTPTSLPLSPPPQPGNARNLLVLAAIMGLIVVSMGVAVWWVFFRGPNRMDYEKVAFQRSLRANDEVNAVAISPDGTLIAGGCKDGVIEIWDAATLDRKREIRNEAASISEVISLAFSSDSKTLASGRADANVIVWNAQTGEKITTLRGHSGRVNSVAFAMDGQTLASGAEDGTVKLWDVSALGGQPKRSLSLDVPVKAVAFSSDGSTVAGAGGSGDGHLRLWDTTSYALKSPEITKSAIITSLAFSKDGKLAGGTSDGTVVIWDAQRTQANVLRGHKSQVNGVAFSPLGESVVTGGADTKVLLWEAAALGPYKKELPQNAGVVYGVAISRDGLLIASAGADKSVKVWASK